MSKALGLVLILFSCLFAFSKAQCSSFQPAVPTVVSPVLGSTTTILSQDYSLFVWNRPDYGQCENVNDEYYEVMVAEKDSTVPIDGYPLCGVEKAGSCQVSDFSQLQDGKEYKWSVKLTYNTTAKLAVMETETAGFFAWCEPAAPQEPKLTSPVSNTTFSYQTNIVFSWNAIPAKDFGKSCNGTTGVINIYISRYTTSLDGLKFSKTMNSISFTYDMNLNPPLEPGVWYWSIEASNILFGTTSLVNSFNVLEPDPIPCIPDCIVGQGACNTTKGECVCVAGFKGEDCSQPITSPTSAPTEPQSDPTGLIIGLVVAGVVVLLIIGFLVFFYMREKKKRQKFEMTTILIEPPDFASLAFQPYSITPSAFGEAVAKKSSWRSFEQLLLSDDYGLVLSILSSARMVNLDNLCTWLVIVFENNKSGSNLIQTLMLRELEEFESQKDANANHESNPMPYRGDSAATKAFKVYTRIVGLPYLFETLGQILNDFCALLDESEKGKEQESEPNNRESTATSGGQTSASLRPAFNQMSMEVDPKRMNSEDDETINRLSLQLICQKLFVKIFRSVDIFPVEIRVLCKKIRDESKRKDSLQNVNLNVLLSNLIFLRFINPAILVPHQCGIVKDEPAKGTQRQLILITKVLQNLAANVEFGKKEAFMTKLNDFIRANFGQMNSFLSSLTENIDANAAGVAKYSTPISVSILNSSLAGLYEYVYNNQELVLASAQRVVSTRKAAHIEETLQSILREIGDPSSYQKK